MTRLYPEPQEPPQEIRRDRRIIALVIPGFAIVLAFLAVVLFPFREDSELLHVSYDASREFYAALNEAYDAIGDDPKHARILMSHAGSVRQASNLAHGQIADVVSLASAYDLQSVIDRNGCPDPHWQDRFPNQSAPFHSSISLVVRTGNPKQIRDWPDLWRPDVKLALPSPSRSGGGRWAFLALRSAAQTLTDSESAAYLKLQALYLRATPLDAGARAALSLFANRRDLDAYLTWESDALQLAELGFTQLEAVHFPRSILAEPRIGLLLCHVEQRDTKAAAQAYLDFHFSETGQRLAAAHHLRPSDPAVAAAQAVHFPPTQLFAVPPDSWHSTFSAEGLYRRLEKLRFAQQGGHE